MKALKFSFAIYAFLLFTTMSAWGETVTFNVLTYATTQEWTNGTAYSTATVNEHITINKGGEGDNGKFYTSNNSWRFYESNSGTITLTTTSGTFSSVTFTYSSGNSGILKQGDSYASSGSAFSISGNSVTFSVTHSSGTKNGNVQITAISITYTPAPSCTSINPTVTYSATTLYKGETATISSITGNTGNASVTYASSDATVASVNSSTGEVTALKAGSATITASFAESGEYCSKDVNIEFSIKYRVKWSVNGDDTYAKGSPTSSIDTDNTKVTTFPTAPTSSDCDDSKVFVGWTNAPYNHSTDAPTILFTTASSSPNITDNTTFYAVFATATGGATEYTKVSSVTAGTYVMVSEKTTDTFRYMPNTTSSGSNPTLGTGITMNTTAGITKLTNTVTDAMLWDFTSTGETNQYYLRPHNSTTIGLGCTTSTGAYIRISNTYKDVKWTITTSASCGWQFKSNATTAMYLAVYSDDNWRNYSSSTTNQNGKFYLFKQSGGTTYSDYATSCCTSLGAIKGSLVCSNRV